MGAQDKTGEQQHGNEERQQHGENHEGGGRTGEGAASAMRQMIRQGDRNKRHRAAESDDAAGHAQ